MLLLRFLPPAGTILALSSPGQEHCGTWATGWQNGTLPTAPGSTLDIQVTGSLIVYILSVKGKFTKYLLILF